MDWTRIREKLSVLADAAKYDVSCSSSGSKRKNNGGLGDTTGMGICHSYTEDGRCISLLKILLTNVCIFDCQYCVSRRSNDEVKRVAFTVEEVVDLTINFYRRNYIEGLFLSSGIFKNADFTMERLVRVAKTLRLEHAFNGYIHLKTIPGCSEDLIAEAGKWADRLSVNIELPSGESLAKLAPEKTESEIIRPMGLVQAHIEGAKQERGLIRKADAPKFAPAGQSTQMVVGASPETDLHIVNKAASLYKDFGLKRVFYSGYVPVNSASNLLPGLESKVPILREHRLYQADWLMRFYGFNAEEIVDPEKENLEPDVDPKLAWALRFPALFPIDINTADYEMILRVPGIGVGSAKKIVSARRFGPLGWEQLRKIGISANRAKYFITCKDRDHRYLGWAPEAVKGQILAGSSGKYAGAGGPQLALF